MDHITRIGRGSADGFARRNSGDRLDCRFEARFLVWWTERHIQERKPNAGLRLLPRTAQHQHDERQFTTVESGQLYGDLLYVVCQPHIECHAGRTHGHLQAVPVLS